MGVFIFMGAKRVMAFYGSDDQVASAVSSASAASGRFAAARPVSRDPAKPDYLRGRELTLIGNMGTYPNYDYVIEAVKGESWYRLTKTELLKLGYTLQPINQCLVLLKINEQTYQVSCRRRGDSGLVNFDWTTGEKQE